MKKFNWLVFVVFTEILRFFFWLDVENQNLVICPLACTTIAPTYEATV